MKSRDIALVAAAAVIAYLIYLYEKKKGVVASQITAFKATATPVGTPITNEIVAPAELPISGSSGGLYPELHDYANLLPTVTPEGQPYVDLSSISELPLTALPSYSGGTP